MKKHEPVARMDDGLFHEILGHLKHAGTVRLFTPMLQSEPFLDPKIIERIRKSKVALGHRTSVYIVTNGSLLSRDQIDDLLGAGLDYFEISIDAFREETYQAIRTGLDFSRVTNNVHSLLERSPRPRVIVRFLRQAANAGEEKDFIGYWKGHGAAVFLFSPINRAGTMDLAPWKEAAQRGIVRQLTRRILNALFPFCPLPFYSLNVLVDGRTILCCHDWKPSVLVGQFAKQSLSEIWNGEVLNNCRYLLYSHRSKEIASCKHCSYVNGFWSSDTPGPERPATKTAGKHIATTEGKS
jgi:MoaA/NifB/PqqE/SkfB family radical SAM enzyme